jgi:hypothetical protein
MFLCYTIPNRCLWPITWPIVPVLDVTRALPVRNCMGHSCLGLQYSSSELSQLLFAHNMASAAASDLPPWQTLASRRSPLAHSKAQLRFRGISTVNEKFWRVHWRSVQSAKAPHINYFLMINGLTFNFSQIALYRNMTLMCQCP